MFQESTIRCNSGMFFYMSRWGLILILALVFTGFTEAIAADDVDALAKQANSDLRKAQNEMFSSKYEASDELLKKASEAIEKMKAADPDNSKIKSLESKYTRQRKDLDKRMNKSTTATTSSSSSSAKSAASASDKLPAGVTKRLKDYNRNLDSAESSLTKESNISDESRAEQAVYALDSADSFMEEIVKMYGDQISMDHPDLVAAKKRCADIQKQADALAGKVADLKAKEEADLKAKADSKQAEEDKRKAGEAAWASRVIDKKQAAKDWTIVDKLSWKYQSDFMSQSYFTKNGAVFIQEWNDWKKEFLPLWERFEKSYGTSYEDLEYSFKDVQKPLGVKRDVINCIPLLKSIKIDEQEKQYVSWAMNRGRDSFNRWQAMTNPDPTKIELKYDYTDRALNSFKLAKKLDPEGDYDEFIAQAQAAQDQTKPMWLEALKKIEWPGHNPDFAGPGKPDELAAAALDFLRKVDQWTKPEYDDEHIPLAACVQSSGWAVSKKNILSEPLQYSINITVAFTGKKSGETAYVYNMVFYTGEELGINKGLPFKYANSRQYEKHRMLKSKISK